jgi:hypothetical protein
MNRDLLLLPVEAAVYPTKLKRTDGTGTVEPSENEATKDHGLKNINRFKRYKKNLQKRARSIF